MKRPRDRRSIDELPDVPLSSHVTAYLGFYVLTNGELSPEHILEVSRNDKEREQLRTAVSGSVGVEVTDVDIILGLQNLSVMFK